MKLTYIILIIVVLIIVVGYFTNWFGMSKNSNETQTDSSRTFQNNTINKYTCPEGYSLYTNSFNGHSICVKLSTGEIKEPIKSN